MCSLKWVAREKPTGKVAFKEDLQVGRMYQREET